MPYRFDTYPVLEELLRVPVGHLARAGVTPNQLTVSMIMLSFIGGALVVISAGANWSLLLLPVFMLVRLACNHMDGLLARDHAMRSRLGVFLNELGDAGGEMALHLPLALIGAVPGPLLVSAVMLGTLCEMAGIVSTMIGEQRRRDGSMTKKTRGMIFGAIAVALGLGVAPGLWD